MRLEDFLESVQEARLEERRMSERIEELESRARKITPAYAQNAGGGGESGGPQSLWALLADERSQLELRHRRACEREIAVERFIQLIPGPNQRMVLRLRYLDGKRLEDAAGVMHYSYDWTRRTSAGAMKAARKLWRERYGDFAPKEDV